LPRRFGFKNIHADQDFAQFAGCLSDGVNQLRAQLDDIAEPFDAVAGRNPGDHMPVRVDPSAGGNVAVFDRHF